MSRFLFQKEVLRAKWQRKAPSGQRRLLRIVSVPGDPRQGSPKAIFISPSLPASQPFCPEISRPQQAYQLCMEPVLKRACPGRALILSIKEKKKSQKKWNRYLQSSLAQAATQFKGPEDRWEAPSQHLAVALLPSGRYRA